MNLATLLAARAEAGRPIRVGLIGAGKFGTMFLAQAERQRGIHIVGVCDLNPAAAKDNLALVGWAPERHAVPSLDEAARTGATHVGDDWRALVSHPAVEIVIEATGNPMAAVTHVLQAFREGKHVINVTVEADAFVGPGFAAKAAEAGVIYSMAYGDQPALAADLVDWARACGFAVAGRGHKWLPHYRQSTPDTVWDHWGLTREQAERGDLIRRCSTLSSMAPSPPSSPRPSPMLAVSMHRPRVSRSRQVLSMMYRRSRAPGRKAAC